MQFPIGGNFLIPSRCFFFSAHWFGNWLQMNVKLCSGPYNTENDKQKVERSCEWNKSLGRAVWARQRELEKCKPQVTDTLMYHLFMKLCPKSSSFFRTNTAADLFFLCIVLITTHASIYSGKFVRFRFIQMTEYYLRLFSSI